MACRSLSRRDPEVSTESREPEPVSSWIWPGSRLERLIVRYAQTSPSPTLQWPISRAGVWDRFVEALDDAADAETIAGIPVPPLDLDMPCDKRFADLTGAEVEHLARVGDMLGRRGHEITTMWKAIGRRASESPFV